MQTYAIPMLAYYRACRTPNRVAVYDYDVELSYTYHDLNERSDRVAGFFVNTLKLEKGDRVGFIAKNNICFFDMFYVSCKTGIMITTYNGRMMVSELLKMIENEDPKVIIFSSDYHEKAQAVRFTKDGERNLICIETDHAFGDIYRYQDLLNAAPLHETEYACIDWEDPQMLIHTGGTTGVPKAAVLSYRCLFMNAVSEILTWGINADDSALIVMPLYHSGGWNLLSLPLLMVGGKIILTAEFKPETFFRVSRNIQPSIFMGVSTMFKVISQHPDFEVTDFSQYKWLINGGAPISKTTLEPYWKCGLRVFNGYGMTEIGPNNLTPDVSSMSFEENQRKVNTVGKPFMFTECKIVNPEGKVLNKGERGELYWRGDLSFSGYWNDPAATADILSDGWIRSGDIGYQDEDGDIYICGRTKNMYITCGENIFPAEIEEVIDRYPGVFESCVIGVSDLSEFDRGEVGKALIVREAGSDVTVNELEIYLKENLSSIKRPKFIEFIESIPKNGAGKRDISAIEERYANNVDLAPSTLPGSV
jgi:fatty-acyl-CoA synthase